MHSQKRALNTQIIQKMISTGNHNTGFQNNLKSTLSISTLIWTTLDNVVFFKVDFRNVGQRQKDVVNLIICKKLTK